MLASGIWIGVITSVSTMVVAGIGVVVALWRPIAEIRANSESSKSQYSKTEQSFSNRNSTASDQ